jgi:glutathione S-transferase
LHSPLLGEPMLRLRTGQMSGRLSVPLLIGDGWQLSDSFDIARWADRAGSKATLFPPAEEAELHFWNEQSDALLSAGRLRTTMRVLESPEALSESVPPSVRRLGRAGLPLARQGARWLLRKYAIGDNDADELLVRMLRVLDKLHAALADGRRYLLGEFSFADIAMAVSLQFVCPPLVDAVRLGPASRRAWTEPTLSREYKDLLAWRDALYEQHRHSDPTG